MNKILKLLSSIFIITVFSFSPKFTTLANNTKEIAVELWHAENSGKLSMGSKALDKTATITNNNDGTATVTIKFVPMDFMNMHGHLLSLSVYSKELFDGELTKAEVLSTYEDTNLDGAKQQFPEKLQFKINTTNPDKIGVKVSVDAMDKIMGSDASQNAILKFGNTTQQTATSKIETTNEAGTATSKLEDYFKESTKTKETGLYTIDVTAAYLNPLTGITADGGTKNAAIGEGMSQGVISPVNSGGNITEAMSNQQNGGEKRWSKALLQRTSDGKLYATVRIHLINWIKRSPEQGPFIKVLQQDGSLKQVEAVQTKEHLEQYKDNYADYRFEVPNENFLAMVQMFVEPMNRPVRFFVTPNVDTITQGTNDMEAIKETNYTPYIIGGVLVVALCGGLLAGKMNRGRKNEKK